MPGQLVDVTVELSDIPGALVVPREAVNTGQDGQFVYVVTPDMVAELRPVKLLFDDGVNDAVEGNLHDGDQVIVDGQLRVIPGGKVSISRAQAGAGGAGATPGRRQAPRRQARRQCRRRPATGLIAIHEFVQDLHRTSGHDHAWPWRR